MTALRATQPLRRTPTLRRPILPRDVPDGGCRQGHRRSSCNGGRLDSLDDSGANVGDLDLVWFGLLGDGDGDGEHPVRVSGDNVFAVEALTKEQLTPELTFGPLRDVDLIVVGPDPGAEGVHGEDVFLDGQFDGTRIGAGDVEEELELVAPTIRIHGDLAGPAIAQQLLGQPVDLTERFESHQHWVDPLSDARAVGGRRPPKLDVWSRQYA